MELSFNQLGFPLIKRREEIKNKKESATHQYVLDIQGRQEYLPVIRVRIDFPVYRLANGRTKSAQKEYLATHKDTVEPDLFTKDHDSYEAQQVQHELLTTLVKEEDLLSSFRDDGVHQVEPIICTNTGVVVNGNRRLCAWRILYNSDPIKYSYFESIDIAILPELSEDEIYSLEKKLQIQKTMRAEYHWHTKALMIEEELRTGAKAKDIARSYGMKVKELQVLVAARKMASRYLEVNGQSDQWSRVDKARYAFESVVKCEEKIHDQNERELFRKMAFNLISSTKEIDGVSDRLYKLIPQYANSVPEFVAEQVKKLDEISTPHDDQPAIEENDDSSLLLGGDTVEQDDASRVSEAIESGLLEIHHDEIKRIIDRKAALESERVRSTILVDELSRISARMKEIIGNYLIEDTNTDGVEEQLSSIESSIQTIRKWANKKS